MLQSQRSAKGILWWLRLSAAGVAGLVMFLAGYQFLNDKLKLWQVATLESTAPPPGVSKQDWYLQCEHTHRFYVVFGEHELMRDDNPESRDTRADIARWGNLVEWVAILVPLACGVIVWAGVYVLWGLFLPNRKRDES